MTLEQIIKKQEEEIRKRAYKSHILGDVDSVSIETALEMHSSSIKEILEGVKQFTLGQTYNSAKPNKEERTWNEAKSDTINYLEDIIKKLTKTR